MKHLHEALLLTVQGIGEMKLKKLRERFGDAGKVWNAEWRQLHESGCLGAKEIEALLAKRERLDFSVVEKDWTGFAIGTHYNKMGIRSSATAELLFHNVAVPMENLLGKEGQGFTIAMQTLEGGRIGIVAQALGLAQGAYEKALNYAKERILEK